jgi:hypothetical protein
MLIVPNIEDKGDLADIFYMASAFSDAVDNLVESAEACPKARGSIRFLAMALGDISRWMVDQVESGCLSYSAESPPAKRGA